MSTPSASPAGSILARAVIVLLATLLAHAWVLQRVDRMLAGTEPEAAAEAGPVKARLLPPEIPPPAAQSGPASPPPRPRPVRAAKKPSAPVAAPLSPAAPTAVEAPAAVEARAAVEFPPTIDVGPDAFGVEAPPVPQASETTATNDASANGQAEPPAAAAPTEETATAAEAEPFVAAGAALHAALAGLAMPEAALPPAARYVYRTTNSEVRIASGTTTVDWSHAADGTYLLRLTTTAVGVTVLELQSQGTLRPFGLAPERYTESRIRRGKVAANFDWDRRRVTFSSRTHERPLDDGVQDRISFQFQLMLLGQAQPERFREGRQTVLRMAGRDDVFTYRFRSVGPATTDTGLGELQTVKIERIATDDTDARVEVWLAPSLSWLPARLRFTDRYGRVTESVLESTPGS